MLSSNTTVGGYSLQSSIITSGIEIHNPECRQSLCVCLELWDTANDESVIPLPISSWLVAPALPVTSSPRPPFHIL